ncbi:MAG: MipA/OmpV family protein [Limnohabitans sp.]
MTAPPTHTRWQPTWLGALCGLTCCTALTAWAQETPAETTPALEAPAVTPWTYSLGLRTDIANLSHPGSMKLRPSLGLRYGRWRIGQTDGTDWHRFGQVLQDNNLTYDVRQDSKWSVSLSGSIINLDNNSQFDALKSGRKTLRAKAGLDYRLPNRWSVGLIATQDVFMRGDGTSLSPTLTYRQPLSEHSSLMLSQSVTWGSASHWQTQQQLGPEGYTHRGAGWGSVSTQLAYRYKLSRHWGLFSQLGAQRTLQPIFPSPLSAAPEWTYSGQLGVVYFEH